MAKRWSYYRIYEVYSLEVFSFTVKNPIILCLGALRELGIGSLLPPLLLSRFSCVRLCATPQMAAHQAPLSLGFRLGFRQVFRQEYWSGLPFPSPMYACMLSRFSRVQLCATLWTAAHQAPLSIAFSRQEYQSGFPFPSTPCYGWLLHFKRLNYKKNASTIYRTIFWNLLLTQQIHCNEQRKMFIFLNLNC